MNTDDVLIILQEEVDKLRKLKSIGQFGLQQAENSLKRISEIYMNEMLKYMNEILIIQKELKEVKEKYHKLRMKVIG